MRIIALVFLLSTAGQADGGDGLAVLVEALKASDDPQFHLDVLSGIRDGLQGRRRVKMPAGWPDLSAKLAGSPQASVRTLVRELSLTFGDLSALEALRRTLADGKAATSERLWALSALLGAQDPGLAAALHPLLKEPALRGAAIRGLAAYDDPKTPAAVLEVYGALDVSERRDAVNTLIARLAYARDLLVAVDRKAVPRSDLSAATVRQLREFKDAAIDRWIEEKWGAIRATPEAKAKEIAAMKEMLAAAGAGDPARGRALFARTCQQCHILFGEGGKVGPELTGSNRADLDYLLSNILDPSAIMAREYQSWTIRTRSERLVSGILSRQDEASVTIVTENDTLVLPRGEIDVMKQNEISMMPENLLGAHSREEIRDLVAYLRSPAAPQEGTALFNGRDLAGWEGNDKVWKVEEGEIVGRGPAAKNEFLWSKTAVGDFRLVLDVKLAPDSGNSGIQFRSQKQADGAAKGYQADVGAGWWGKLYHEHGRALLWDKPADAHVKKGDWNTYEILAVGNRIRTALNGNLCVDYTDEKPDLKGLVALQVHSGPAMEVRFRNVRLEHDPKFELKTLKK